MFFIISFAVVEAVFVGAGFIFAVGISGAGCQAAFVIAMLGTGFGGGVPVVTGLTAVNLIIFI